MRSSGRASTSVAGYQKPLPVGRVAAEERLAFDERRDRLAVRGRDQRPHLGRLVLGVADLHPARRLDEQLGEAVVRALLDEDARARAAVLAGVVEDGVRRALAAAFSRSASAKTTFADLPPSSSVTRLIVDGGAPHHHLPDLGRAGEADLRDVRMLDQSLPDDRALADDDVQHALGDAGLERELAETHASRAASAPPA